MSTVESGILDWVKDEISQTLGRAHEAIGDFSSHTGDLTPLRMYAGHLHQVAGTLQMVELDGAAMLAKEAESLADAMIHDGGRVDMAHAISLLDSSLQGLSAYLDKLQQGMADVPVHNLDLMNELRGARGESPMEIFSIFNPDLEIYPPKIPPDEILDEQQTRTRLRQIRSQFQIALLKWLRDGDSGALQANAGRIDELRRMARFNSVAQLWWIASAYLDMLAVDLPEPNSPQNHVPARLDQVLRKLIEDGESAIVKERSADLVRQMLFDIGHSPSNSDGVAEIKRAFHLNEILNGETDGYELYPLNISPELSGELKGEITDLEQSITNYFDSGQRDPEKLGRITRDLRGVAVRMRQDGPASVADLVDEVASVLIYLADQPDSANESAIALQVAESLLYLEQTVSRGQDLDGDWLNGLGQKIEHLQHLQQMGAATVSPTNASVEDRSPLEVKDLLSAVAGEIFVNLDAAEASLESFAAQPDQTSALEPVPGNLAQVQGALQMLGQHKAADMLSTASGYISKLIEGEIEPTSELMDSLAVAVGTAQSFVEGLGHDRPYVHDIVDRAMQDLEDVLTEAELTKFDPVATAAALHQHLETWLTDNANYAAFRQLRQRLKELSAVAGVRNQPKPRRIAQEMNNLLDIVTEDPSFLSAEVEQTLRRSLRTLEDLLGDLAGEESGQDTAAIAAPQLPADVEPEILEIFREEARECTDSITQLFEAWRTDIADESVLVELRRQFHTLKGSGRTANAGPIAELAWIVENLLNQVLDHKLEVSDALLSLVADANREIGEKLDDEKLGAESLELPKWEALSGTIQGEADESPPVAGFEIDDTVVRIFTQETLGHIGTIRDFLGSKSTTVSPELLRAMHTLRGSSRSLHLVEMSNVFRALDQHLNAVNASGEALLESELGLLDKASILSAKVLDRLNSDRTFPATLREEFDNLRAEIDGCRQQTAESRAGTPGGTDHISALGELVSESEGEAFSGVARYVPPIDAVGVDEGADEGLVNLRDIYCEEAGDVLARINGSLDEWRGGKGQVDVIAGLKRELHTLKGSSRAAGYDVIGDLSHESETLLQAHESGFSVDEGSLRLVMEETHDTLVEMVNQVANGRPVKRADDLEERIQDLVDTTVEEQTEVTETGVLDSAQTNEQDLPQSTELERGVWSDEAMLDAAGPTGLSLAADNDTNWAEPGRNVLRVDTNVLDKLVNYAGEVSITRAQMQQQLSGLRSNLSELRSNVSRFGDQLRQLDLEADSQIRARVSERKHPAEESVAGDREFDPLQMDQYTKLQQLSRSMSESLDDLVTIQAGLTQFAHQSESVLQQQAKLSTDLQDGLMSARLVPFSTLTPKLRHQARQTARELHKEAELRVVGGEVEIDRKVLEGISEALVHMIRNALDHGIEAPDHREATGKARSGTILIECRQQGNEVVVRFSDDGAGLDLERIRTWAVGNGLARESDTLTDQDVIQLIVLPGFTTATEVTQLSGRGVGMDVVHNAVRRLGGSIALNGEAGKGTTFVINLPLSLSITQALFARCGSQEFAISLNVIQNVMMVNAEEIASSATGGQALFERDGKVYPVIDLPRRLGLAMGVEDKKRVPILIVRMGAREVAVKVSELMGTQEVVVKSLGSHISRMQGIASATVRADGSVVLILDLAELWLADERQSDADSPELARAHTPPVIMVVDDSLTVRKVTARNLSRHGMEVVMAKDGLDALDQIKKKLPDLMLVDIEMPRMDGYELTERIRGNDETREIPIVIVTSRAGTIHKEKAMALGANGYLTKPYQEDELLANVEACLAHSKGSAELA